MKYLYPPTARTPKPFQVVTTTFRLREYINAAMNLLSHKLLAKVNGAQRTLCKRTLEINRRRAYR